MILKLLKNFTLKILICYIYLTYFIFNSHCEKVAHFELNSIEKISKSLKNTIFIDNSEKNNFSLTNNGFEAGPKIYLDKTFLSDNKKIKKIFKLIRKMLLKFYIEDFGVILTYHLSQIEDIKPMGIDLDGNFKLIEVSSKKNKKKMPTLDKKWLKKDIFPNTNTVESRGLVNSNLNIVYNSVGDIKRDESEMSVYKNEFSFISLKDNKLGLTNWKIKKLHLISSKVNNQIAICKCRINIDTHLEVIKLVQTLLFTIYNTIDSRNSPWYSTTDFISILLKDIMDISSIMRFLGPLFGKFKNGKEYYKRAKKYSNRTSKKYYLNFFNNKRNNYQTKFLLQILGVILSFIGNIFNSFIADFRSNPISNDIAAQIEIDHIQNFEFGDSDKKLFSKQDILLINEYIDRLSNRENCIIYKKINETPINSPDKSMFTLC